MSEASKAPVPETYEGLRRQNSAMRSLLATQEQILAGLTEKGRQYQEAITTLDSERQANEILTAENSAFSAEVEALRAALNRQCDNMAFVLNKATLPDQWYSKFSNELEQDRALLNKESAR